MIPDPAALPLREIHLPASTGWWPPAPGWWILSGVVLLIAAVAWYLYRRHKRRMYSAVNLARQELVGIRSRYAADRDARHCVRAVSGLLRRLCISVFPRTETAGLTGAEWLAFLDRAAPGKGFTDNAGRVLLEAPYRKHVEAEEVEPLVAFCSDWIETLAGTKR